MPDPSDQNAFEQLCRMASEERWCWKIPCTTCGNMEFRYGFRAITQGHSPSQPDWIVHRQARGLRERYGRLGYPRQTPWRERIAVLKICADANLATIAEQCEFPDWLGYLGLIVFLMRCPNSAYRKTMTLWAQQLRDMVPQDHPIWSTLDRAVRSPDRLLAFEDLEGVEVAMLRDRPPAWDL